MRTHAILVRDVRRALGLGFPLHADAREKIGSGGRVFGGDFVAERAVVADGRSADEHGGRNLDPADRLDEAARGVRRLSRMRRLCSSVQRLPAIDSPARFTTAPAPSISAAQGPALPLGLQGTVRCLEGARAALAALRVKIDDLVAVGGEGGGEGPAEEAGAAGDDDFHAGSSVTSASSLKRIA